MEYEDLAKIDIALIDELPYEKKVELLDLLKKRQIIHEENKLQHFKPYQKQKEFIDSTASFSQCAMMGGNQLGKSLCGAMIAAILSTGLYPDWWRGRVIKKANKGWVSGLSYKSLRDSMQTLIIGDIALNKLGTGSIPRDHIVHVQPSRGVPGGVDYVVVKHVSGHDSIIYFKSADQGRLRYQGSTIDWTLLDEEHSREIYGECLTRTNKGQSGQLMITTFTPLIGISELVDEFVNRPSSAQKVTMMGIDDVEHYTEEEKKNIIASYPEHEREARAYGIPSMGSGRIFRVSMESIMEDPIIDIPKHWRLIIGIDFGWDHPQASVLIGYDADEDVIHVLRVYRESQVEPCDAAPFILAWGNWIPVSWPHDGNQHVGFGKHTAQLYKEAGLNMLWTHATFEDGSNNVEPGILEILMRMKDGRFKVGRDLAQWWEEFRMYHRKNGKIVKKRDDIMAATRYAVMMLREARNEHDVYKPIKFLSEF